MTKQWTTFLQGIYVRKCPIDLQQVRELRMVNDKVDLFFTVPHIGNSSCISKQVGQTPQCGVEGLQNKRVSRALIKNIHWRAKN